MSTPVIEILSIALRTKPDSIVIRLPSSYSALHATLIFCDTFCIYSLKNRLNTSVALVLITLSLSYFVDK